MSEANASSRLVGQFAAAIYVVDVAQFDRLRVRNRAAIALAAGAGPWRLADSRQLVAEGVKTVYVLNAPPDVALTIARHCANVGLEARLPHPACEPAQLAEWFDAGAVPEGLGQLIEPTPTTDRESERTNARAGRASEAGEARVLFLTPASTIVIRPVKWLWQDRLALGTVALIGGREGVGKTIASYTLGADITRGRLAGAHCGSPRAVIVAATEDSWEHTIVPRLMAAGADLDRVFRVDVISTDGLATALSLPKDLVELERVIRKVDASLVILDPLLSRLDASLDTHKDAEVRQAMEPLVTLAGATDACVLGLIHVNKSASSDALTLLMGSRAFAAVSRSVLFVMTDPDDESRRLIGTPKNNLGRTDLPTLAFQILGVKVADTPEGEVWTGQLRWLGESERSIRDAIETTAEATINRTATTEATGWLEDFLTADDEPIESAAVKRAGAQAGHSKDALHRACQRLGVLTKSVGFPRKTYWHLSASHRNAGRLQMTATTAMTATTGADQGRHTEEERDERDDRFQSSQSSQSSQSFMVPARARQLDPWADLPQPPGSVEAAAAVAARLVEPRGRRR